MRKLGAVLAVTLIVAVGVGRGVASACTITDPSRPSNGQTGYAAGYLRDVAGGHYYQNVFSDILVKEPDLVSYTLDSYTTSYAWVMLTSGSGLGEGYAQVGPIREWSPLGCTTNCTEARFNYAECNKDNGTPADRWQHWWAASSPNNAVGYEVFADQKGVQGPAGAKYFLINGVEQSEFCGYPWGPGQAQIAGEIHDRASQVPGSISNPENFTNARDERDDGYDPPYFDGSEYFGSTPSALPIWFEYGRNDSSNVAHVNDGDCS